MKKLRGQEKELMHCGDNICTTSLTNEFIRLDMESGR